MTDKRGFSLIELLVVVVLLGILLGIAGISGKAWLDRYRVESQTKELYADVMNARSSAMQRNRMHFITFTASQYAIYEDTNPLPDGDGNLQTGSDRTVVQKSLNPSYSITYGDSQIEFDSRGLAHVPGTLTYIRVTESFGAAYDCIAISPTRTRIGAWHGTCVVQ